MRRQWMVAVVVVAGMLLAVGLFLRGGSERREESPVDERSFVSDSLGVAMRLPDSPGWSLRRDLQGVSGRVLTASHEDGTASVRMYALTTTEQTQIDDVFRNRKRDVANRFGVQDFDLILSKVMNEDRREVNGRPFFQWQAVAEPFDFPGEDKPQSVVFMWLMFLQPGHSVEFVGFVRFSVERTPLEEAKTNALLEDVATILTSIQIR